MDPPSTRSCSRELTPQAAVVGFSELTWLPYVTSSGRQWWYFEGFSLWCFDDARDDIQFALMAVNEPRYSAQLTAAGHALGAQWALNENQAGFYVPTNCPVFMQVSPDRDDQEWLEDWRTHTHVTSAPGNTCHKERWQVRRRR